MSGRPDGEALSSVVAEVSGRDITTTLGAEGVAKFAGAQYMASMPGPPVHGFIVILAVVYSPFFVNSPAWTCGGFSDESSSIVCRHAGTIVCLNFSRADLFPGTIFCH